MACPRCSLRLLIQSKRPKILIPSRRAFHTSPQHQRLGAFTYAQEWQTGTYHFNKALNKTLPVASQHVDELLTAYATQQKRRVDRSNPLYNQITRTNITAQRRQPERVFISKSTAKDFGDRMEVTAYLYDGVGAAEAEKEARRKKKMGVKEGEGAQGGNRRGPARRRPMGGATTGEGTTGGARGTARARPASGAPAFRSIGRVGAGSSVQRTAGAPRGGPPKG